MRIQKKDVLYGEISRHNPVTMKVKPGEIFQVETELNTGSWLKSIDDLYHPSKIEITNAVSGCICVEGAKSGDMLKIKIIDIVLNNLGYTGWDVGLNPFPDWIREKEWGTVTKTVFVKDGFVHWSDEIKIPVQPLIGVIGTAPSRGCPITPDLGEFGGNMDIQEVTIGNTLYLPVFMEGALLHIGDVHAVQGDGEVCCGGGIEIASVCTLQIEVLPKPKRMIFPRLEGDGWIAAIGIAKPMEEACRIAIKELVNWMVEDYSFTQPDALLLLGQVLEARCTQIVDPKYSYIAKINKKYLKPVNDAKYF
jgi:acetamidase/formamidase